MARRQDWAPAKRVKALEELARDMVGDGKFPNIFFTSVEGNIFVVTLDFTVAYRAWKAIPRDMESALEDRQTGVIASVEPEEEGSSRLVVLDNSTMFGFR